MIRDPRDLFGRDGARCRKLAALVIAGGLALYVAASLARAPTGSGDDVGRMERTLLPLREALRSGDRLALLVNDDKLATWYLAQYVFAPTKVVRVRTADCWRLATPSSCAAGATHLLILNAPPDQAAALGSPLGFAPLKGSPAGILLARKSR